MAKTTKKAAAKSSTKAGAKKAVPVKDLGSKQAKSVKGGTVMSIRRVSAK